jgi:hypothetical protein
VDARFPLHTSLWESPFGRETHKAAKKIRCRRGNARDTSPKRKQGMKLRRTAAGKIPVAELARVPASGCRPRGRLGSRPPAPRRGSLRRGCGCGSGRGCRTWMKSLRKGAGRGLFPRPAGCDQAARSRDGPAISAKSMTRRNRAGGTSRGVYHRRRLLRRSQRRGTSHTRRSPLRGILSPQRPRRLSGAFGGERQSVAKWWADSGEDTGGRGKWYQPHFRQYEHGVADR